MHMCHNVCTENVHKRSIIQSASSKYLAIPCTIRLISGTATGYTASRCPGVISLADATPLVVGIASPAQSNLMTLSPEHQSAQMSKITNDGLTWSGLAQDAL